MPEHHFKRCCFRSVSPYKAFLWWDTAYFKGAMVLLLMVEVLSEIHLNKYDNELIRMLVIEVTYHLMVKYRP